MLTLPHESMIVTHNNEYKQEAIGKHSCLNGFPAAINKALHQERWFTMHVSRKVRGDRDRGDDLSYIYTAVHNFETVDA